jgi:succinyl-CoA synthetase beta subunit
MKLLEHQGKQLLAASGVPTPDGGVASRAEDAAALAGALGGRVVVKAQVTAGKRGKAGAVLFADDPAGAQRAAADLLGSSVGGLPVHEVLVERAVPIARELYAAILNDPASKRPLVLFSTAGGMDIEEVSASTPELLLRLPVDVRTGLTDYAACMLLARTDLSPAEQVAVADTLCALYRQYRAADAELLEINPLVLTTDGQVVALDAKISLDPGARPRRSAELVRLLEDAPPDAETDLERDARALGLQFIELDGSVGVLANGAGLTMTTLDAVNHYGGRPANFLEIGGDAYTKATPALRLVLRNPNVRSLLVNFCGAFARTDVMTAGVLAAIDELRPEVPVFFSIHGTGEKEAVAMVRDQLGQQPYEHMDDAVRAAVAAAAPAHDNGKDRR